MEQRHPCEPLRAVSHQLEQVVGFIYPNEVETQWAILIVVLPVQSRASSRAPSSSLAGEGVQRGRGAADLPAGLAHGARLHARGRDAAAAAPGAPAARLRDLHDASTTSAMAMFGFVYLWYLARYPADRDLVLSTASSSSSCASRRAG